MVEILNIGVLALQGGFSDHRSHLQDSALHFPQEIRVQEVRTGSELKFLDGLVIPGGESTSMSILLAKNEDLRQGLKEFARRKPVFGTCAGMILLANEVEDSTGNHHGLIGGIDIKVSRNFYGSQTQSFEAIVSVENEELESLTRMLFIRAPGVIALNEPGKVMILAKHNHSIVAVRQNNLIATSFHPELTPELRWHIYFLKMVHEYKTNN